MTRDPSKEQIQAMDTAELRSILRSTNPASNRFALHLVWARDEIERRYATRAHRREWGTGEAHPSVGPMSDETRPPVETARKMLALGINIQATGEATNDLVTGIIQSLLSHIDELDADLKCAVAVGRYAANQPYKAEAITYPPGHSIHDILRDVAELPGDHSPDDPMVMMVTPDELEAILELHLGQRVGPPTEKPMPNDDPRF